MRKKEEEGGKKKEKVSDTSLAKAAESLRKSPTESSLCRPMHLAMSWEEQIFIRQEEEQILLILVILIILVI